MISLWLFAWRKNSEKLWHLGKDTTKNCADIILVLAELPNEVKSKHLNFCALPS